MSYIDNVLMQLPNKFRNNCKGVFTFPKGGLVLASILANRLDVPILMNPVKGCIIIEDICDTGITLKKYSDLNSESIKKGKGQLYLITTMIKAERQKYDCTIDYYWDIKKKDKWAVFPWEKQ